MRNVGITAAIGTGILFALLASRTQAIEPDSQRYSQIERGRYLARAADCTACHMEPGAGSPFGGGRYVEPLEAIRSSVTIGAPRAGQLAPGHASEPEG